MPVRHRWKLEEWILWGVLLILAFLAFYVLNESSQVVGILDR